MSWNPVCPNMNEAQRVAKKAQSSQILVMEIRELQELRAEKEGDVHAAASVGAVNFVECFGVNSNWNLLPVFGPSACPLSCSYVAVMWATLKLFHM